MILVACADPKDSGSHEDMDYYLVDVGISLQQLIFAATDLGLGTCWIGAFKEDIIKAAIAVPENVKIVALTPLGYPAEKESLNAKLRGLTETGKRKPLEEIVHKDKW